ncbi:uncharacterized protein LOC120259466 isoform X1 [Dioscorea cayenensis subsp. rotundata]|uniref:Uncharacterized protein LOC120259466 isoform X1 n=1 Tax=Dioscorea cayennensis subsp. rotundata TaxID=55577 RepID=A0AB40B7F1_DIOCR|nr:uncharacterized protein LOC120259466 isoform X1 [Dioscorea cayenensis subsp. rotundata]
MSLLCCAWGSKVSSSASFLYDFAVSTVLLHLLFGPICCSLDDNQDGLNILKLLELPSLLTRRSMKSSIPNVMLAVVYAVILYLFWTPETLELLFASKYRLTEISIFFGTIDKCKC